jgi:hypothetical protein
LSPGIFIFLLSGFRNVIRGLSPGIFIFLLTGFQNVIPGLAPGIFIFIINRTSKSHPGFGPGFFINRISNVIPGLSPGFLSTGFKCHPGLVPGIFIYYNSVLIHKFRKKLQRMIIYDIIALAINQLLKKTMKDRESISLYHFLKGLKTGERR